MKSNAAYLSEHPLPVEPMSIVTTSSQTIAKPNVSRSLFDKLKCKIGWHSFTCKMQDCIDQFGYVPNDGRMPKVAKCIRCGQNYG